MQHRTIVSSLLFAGGLAAAVASGACRDNSATTPAAEVQTQSGQRTNVPMTVAGCLKAGEAAGTFVLTAARSEGQGETATYQLVGGTSPDLQDQIGRKVEVTGTMDTQQEIASTGMRVPAATDKDERPAGTAGTPTVQTKTEIDIKRLSVSSLKPLGDKCDM